MDKTTFYTIKKRLSVLRAEERAMQVQARRIRKEREILERTLAELQAIEDRAHPGARQALPHRQIGHNALVISSILENNGSPVTVKAIAQQAYDTGQISSEKQQKGVYNIVQTVLKRNSKNGKSMFVRVGRGMWDLRSRHTFAVPARVAHPA